MGLNRFDDWLSSEHDFSCAKGGFVGGNKLMAVCFTELCLVGPCRTTTWRDRYLPNLSPAALRGEVDPSHAAVYIRNVVGGHNVGADR